ncbi:MAG: dihydroorotase [Lysobacterales bacterium]|jgi:dihydroorotase
MNSTILFRNATLINEGKVSEQDLLVSKGRIERIDTDISCPEGAHVVDAAGKHLLPGVIDDQVHFREPGLTHKGNIYTESRAAIAGGVTSFMDMPNTRPPTTNNDELAKKHAIAAKNASANYGFYFGATNDNIEAIRSLDPSMVCGVKVFMGSSTGNMLVDNEQTLAGIFRDSPVVIATHCESTPMINANIAKAMKRFNNKIPVTEHANIRNTETCIASTRIAVGLAREYGAQLHVLHVSTGAELELFEAGPVDNKSITAETCVHFLHFSDEDYAIHGNRIKCNPAVKSAQDRAALIDGLSNGRLDIIATDHAPHTLEEKANTDYLTAPAGLPLVQDVLLASLELLHDGHFELTELVQFMAHNPAIRFAVKDRGFLREGYAADLVLVDLNASTPVTSQRVLSRCGWSPFEGRTFRSRIASTWVNGVLAFDGYQVIEHGAAQRLEYDRKIR